MFLRDRQQVLICILGAAMIGGFVLFRYLPLRGRIKAVERAIVAQSVAARKAWTQSGQLPVLRERLAKLEESVGNFEAKVPSQRNLGGFLHGIAGLMNEHNLKDQLVQPGKEIQAEGLNCIPVSMKGEGRLEQIFNFFTSLQALDRLIRIEQIELSNQDGFSGHVSMHTEAVIYYVEGTEQG